MTVLELAPPQSKRRSLIWHRDFRLLWIGETTSQFGSRISSVALPLVAISILSASTLQVGLLTVASWLPWLLIGLPAGAWVDRMPSRPVMLTCDFVSLTMYASIPVAAWLGVLTIPHLLVVALLTGASNVFFELSYQRYLRVLLRDDQLQEGNSKLQSTAGAADVGGPGAAGLIANAFGVVGGLLVDSATFLVSAICLMRIKTKEPHTPKKTTETNLRREIAKGLRFVVRDPYLRVLAVSGAASNLALMGYQSITILFLVREVGVTPGTLGTLLMAMSVGGIIGAACSPVLARRFGTAHTMIAVNMIGAPFAMLIPLTAPGWRLAFAAIGGLMVGWGVVAGNVIKSSFRQRYTPRHMLGRVTVSMQFVNYGTIPLGALLGGALGSFIGIRPTMWVMTCAVAVAPLILLIGPIRRSRDLPVA